MVMSRNTSIIISNGETDVKMEVVGSKDVRLRIEVVQSKQNISLKTNEEKITEIISL